MKEQILYRLINGLWTAIVLFIVSLALYVSMGRFLMGNVAQFQDDILRELNARLNFVIEADTLRGRWESLTPYLELEGGRVLGDAHAESAMEVARLSLGFDLLNSVRTGSLQLYVLHVDTLRLHADINDAGELEIPGIPPGDEVLAEQVLRFVLNTERLQVDDFELVLHQQEHLRTLHSTVRLLRDGSFRRLNWSLFNPGEKSWFRIVGEATGDPLNLDKLNADLHMRFQVSDAESYEDLAALAGFSIGRGHLKSEVWLSVRRGELRTAVDFSAADVAITQLAEDSPEMVFDSISATFRADRVDSGWSFGATDIRAAGTEQEFYLEGISGNLREGVLQFQFADIDVASLVDYALEQQLLPAASKGLFATLAPSGHFTSLQATVHDLEAVATSWRLQANFEDLAVNSWKGAPSIANARGYLALSRTEGLLQIDTRDFSMGFPPVYRHTLNYESFSTELAFKVEKDRFELWSGRFSGHGEEGQAHGLFALAVPFGESLAGLEMDLLVGIEDAHPRYRAKYLPYTLAPGLLRWLDGSIGDGHIREAGFIFRGSLKRALAAYRSVQLFSNVDGVELDYHPDWPALSEVNATLYIDNTSVDAFAERARIYDSQAQDVAVTLRKLPGGELMLKVDGALEGSAQDGLDVVNQSPLRKLVGDAFIDWRLDGGLTADLRLELDLTNLQTPPKVALDAKLSGVSLDTGPLGVEVGAINGAFSYRTETGFAAQEISGQLWGQPLLAGIGQGRGSAGLNDLDVQVNGRVEAAAVQNWLQLDMLRLASGATEAEMHIIVPAGGGPRLEISSELVGVALDLPQQFAKAADRRTELKLQMPLSSLPRRLTLSLDERAWLNLVLGEQGLQAAGLGFSQQVPADAEQRLVVGGAIDSMQWDPWMAFVDEYIITGKSSHGTDSSSGSDSSSGPAMLLMARDLHIGELRALGQTLHNVDLSASQSEEAWQLEFSTDWARGTTTFPGSLENIELKLDYLDLDKLPESVVDSLAGEALQFFELPDLQLAAEGLHSGGQELGSLNFSVSQNGPDYHFANITGDLRGLLLGGDTELSLDWVRSSEGTSTHLLGPVRFVNFGDVLHSYGYERFTETNSGRFDMDMHWSGSPTDFELVNTSGRMGVAVDEGSFLKTSAAAEGTLRVMGILNLAEFVRRLSFDMNYLFKSGIPFDSITGELLFHEGQVEVPQMDVLGASSRFQFVGLVDANDATIAGELVATLPVASNLPWIAALIGGLPAAAGVFVVSKVFTKQVDRFSSGVYSINGPWEDPEVKLERIFDNTASHQKVVAEQVEDGEEDAPAAVP